MRPQGGSTTSRPHLVTWADTASGKSVPGLSRRVRCGRRNAQGLCLIHSTPSFPSPHGEIPAPCKTTLLRVLSSETRTEFPHQDTSRRPAGFCKLFQPRSPSSRWVPWASGIFWRACLHLEIVVPSGGDQALQVQGALLWWHIVPSSLRPIGVQSWDPSLSGCGDVTPARVPTAWGQYGGHCFSFFM